jgi:hypothetical protein
MLRARIVRASPRSAVLRTATTSAVWSASRACAWTSFPKGDPTGNTPTADGAAPVPAVMYVAGEKPPAAVDVVKAAKEALARRQKAASDAKAGDNGTTSPANAATLGLNIPKVKSKKKAPWGEVQLRDQWSEDAMTRFDSDNFSGRIDSENRYHPEAHLRKYIKYMFMAFFPLIVFTLSASYYSLAGRSITLGDFQHVLNIIRAHDTSPRSKLSIKRADPAETVP